MDLDAARLAFVDFIWNELKTTGKWPLRHRAAVFLDDRGVTLKDLLQTSRGIWARDGDEPYIQATLGVLLEVAEVREILKPSVEVIRLALAKYIERPSFSDVPEKTSVRWSEVRGFWPDDASSTLASKLLRDGRLGPLGSCNSDGKEIWLEPSVDVLRYDRAKTLDDILGVVGAPRVDVGLHPSGCHLELLRTVFEHQRQHSEWPVALTFAVKHRTLGYVPDLVRDLCPRFIRTEFDVFRHNCITLTPHAVFSIDPSGEGRKLLLEMLRTIRKLWRVADRHRVTVPLRDVAREMGQAEQELRPWFLFFEWSPWWRGSTLIGPDLGIRVDDDVLQNTDFPTWDAYLARWHSEKGTQDWNSLDSVTASSPDAEADSESELLGATAVLDRIAKGAHGLLRQQTFKSVLIATLDEVRGALASKLWRSAVVLIGSATETMVLDVLQRNQGLSASVATVKKWPEQAGLGELAHVARQLGLVEEMTRAFIERVKEYRDLIHPNRAAQTTLVPNQATAKAALHAIELVYANLEQARIDGRLQRFELGV